MDLEMTIKVNEGTAHGQWLIKGQEYEQAKRDLALAVISGNEQEEGRAKFNLRCAWSRYEKASKAVEMEAKP